MRKGNTVRRDSPSSRSWLRCVRRRSISVTSISSTYVKWGILVLARSIRWAMLRRRPTTFTSSTVSSSTAVTGVARFCGSDLTWRCSSVSRSSCTTRPSGPVPVTVARSMPSALARCRTAGAAAAALVRERPLPTGSTSPSPIGSGAASSAGCGSSDGWLSATAAEAPLELASPVAGEFVSMRINGDPTASTSPMSPPSDVTMPATGEGSSTVALSVITSTITWSSAMVSPAATCHSTISASAIPSPTSGSLTTYSLTSRRHHALQRRADACRAGEVVPLLGMGIRSVPPGDPLDRRLELVEAQLLHGCRQLCPEPTGACCLVDDNAAAGLANGLLDRVGVEWQQRAQIDDLGIDPGLVRRGLGDVHHGAVRQHGHVVAGAPYCGFAELDLVIPVGNVAQRVAGPRHHRVVVVPVEGAVVDPLRLEEDDGIVVFDRGDQQALGVVRIRGQDGRQSAYMCEQALRALTVRLATVDAAAARHTDGDRHGELGARSVAQAGRLGDQLVEARIHVVGELDLDDGP